ncbi:hypothetical protein [Mucilaginibacter sp. PPCGB 2223]|nr:hypothetical protein [Mucilaginibacter sp. PPCGB 2223]
MEYLPGSTPNYYLSITMKNYEMMDLLKVISGTSGLGNLQAGLPG